MNDETVHQLCKQAVAQVSFISYDNASSLHTSFYHLHVYITTYCVCLP